MAAAETSNHAQQRYRWLQQTTLYITATASFFVAFAHVLFVPLQNTSAQLMCAANDE